MLKDNGPTKAWATELEGLFTQTPQTPEGYERMTVLLEKLYGYAKSDRRNRWLQASIDKVRQLKESIVDRLQPKMDEEGPYFEMNFVLPRIKDPYVDSLRTGVYTTKVRPADIQEYLEQTNRADGYRGGKKHMMDHFKDPSAMSQLDFLKDLGPGLIAVGIDKTLKAAGKDHGLTFGPGPKTVASMVYNNRCKSDYLEFNNPIPHAANTPEFIAEKNDRRRQLIRVLKKNKQKGGGIAVSMGYNAGNGHVNYLQAWGTPKIDGLEISSLDLARCHMNEHENSASSSAWNNDRIQRSPIDPERMMVGLKGIEDKLRAAGKISLGKQIRRLRKRAQATMQSKGTQGYLNELRAISSDVMAWLKSNLTLDSDDFSSENIVIMPSNTERDDSMSDNAADRDIIGGGSIGSQQKGSANATDGSYFLPLECLAAGWNAKEGAATKYAGFDDADSFVFLSSLETMRS